MSIAERSAEFHWRTQRDLAVLSRVRGLTETLRPYSGFAVFKVPDEKRRVVYTRIQESGLAGLLKEELDPGDKTTDVKQPSQIYLISDNHSTFDTYDRVDGEMKVLGLRLQYKKARTSIELTMQMDQRGNNEIHAALYSKDRSFKIPFRHLTPARLRVLLELFEKYTKGKPIAIGEFQSGKVVGPNGLKNKQKVERTHIFPW